MNKMDGVVVGNRSKCSIYRLYKIINSHNLKKKTHLKGKEPAKKILVLKTCPTIGKQTYSRSVKYFVLGSLFISICGGLMSSTGSNLGLSYCTVPGKTLYSYRTLLHSDASKLLGQPGKVLASNL